MKDAVHSVGRRRSIRTLGGLALAATAVSHAAPAFAQNRPLRIGIIAPRTGMLGFAGECGFRAVEWGVARLNAQGGIGGRKVELVTEEETSPKDTIDRFRKLVLQEKVGNERIVNVLDLNNLSPAEVPVGRVSAAAGAAFVQYIRKAATLALEGGIDAIASAPTNKEAMNLAGFHYAGQTEVFAEVCGTQDYFTVLTGGPLKVFLLSSHVSLVEAIRLVTPDRIERVIRIAHNAMRELWQMERPRIAVAGLNPHAGDSGLFGREEIESVSPVIERLAAEGIDVRGPFSADSLYHSAENGSCDAVVGMYHDQGVIPLKKYGYVTVIAGTPILRTTAGHGTAYDIAGQGIADASVMTRAAARAA